MSLLNLGTLALTLSAQAPLLAPVKTRPAAAPTSVPAVIKDLPVRKVVLYKNGVGYFEHAGQVSGNQRVAIDFTSSQLNDVLQSLTVLDEGGGRIAGVNYNSTMPLEEQLKTLSLGLKDYPSTIAVYHALRGQRLEVTGAGAPLAGRLVNVEFRKETDKNGQTSDDHYFLIVATDAGALRTAELTDAVSVRMADPALQKQFNAYLEILASGQNQQGRHLTLDALGQGQRQLRVSYISAVPVWKSTYRMVFPRVPNGQATVQGWAVVDNTVGADWDNVQLSLVAGAPQSFIQPLSQPIYTHRPEIPIATQAMYSPQTHEAAEYMSQATLNALMQTPRAGLTQIEEMGKAKKSDRFTGGIENLAAISNGVMGSVFSNQANAPVQAGPGYGGNAGGGVYRASDAIQEGDVATNAFDDFFEYALTQPVTIHKNESAMVPILQQELPAQHVTLWSERESQPLRAVWLENKSKLTLDSGSFSIFEGGEFAGEGLLDPIHPGERRLLSYAVDQAVRVKVTNRESKRTLHHVEIHKGAVVETHMDVASITYTAVNSADMDRVVLLEQPRRTNGWSLSDGIKAAETAPNLYRFKLPVAAHSTEKLEVREQGPEKTSVKLTSDEDQREYLLDLASRVPDAKEKLKPVIDAQGTIADLDSKIEEVAEKGKTAAADEARDRENLTALKGNDAAKRFVDELNRAEDQLQETRKQTADLEAQKQAAVDKLDVLIGGLSFDWDVK
jgi:hypothetical protein